MTTLPRQARPQQPAATVGAVASPDVLDAAAMEAAYAQHAGACLARARAVLRDPHMAQDAVQEAFVDHWRHPERYDAGRTSLGGWLVMLTHRKAVDRVRYERRRPRLALDETEREDLVDLDPGPCESALLASECAAVRQLLALLSAVQREAVVLAYWGGYSQSEIARLTGVPLGTVKTRMRRGLILLAAAVEGDSAHDGAIARGART